MMRVNRPVGETERLVKDAIRAAGIADRKIGRDDRGRIEGEKTAMSATGTVLADIATLPERVTSAMSALSVSTILGHICIPFSDKSHQK